MQNTTAFHKSNIRPWRNNSFRKPNDILDPQSSLYVNMCVWSFCWINGSCYQCGAHQKKYMEGFEAIHNIISNMKNKMEGQPPKAVRLLFFKNKMILLCVIVQCMCLLSLFCFYLCSAVSQICSSGTINNQTELILTEEQNLNQTNTYGDTLHEKWATVLCFVHAGVVKTSGKQLHNSIFFLRTVATIWKYLFARYLCMPTMV